MKYVLILFSFSILLIGGCTNNNTPKSHPLPPISENSPLRKPKILSNEEKIEKNLEKIGYKKDCNNITGPCFSLGSDIITLGFPGNSGEAIINNSYNNKTGDVFEYVKILSGILYYNNELSVKIPKGVEGFGITYTDDKKSLLHIGLNTPGVQIIGGDNFRINIMSGADGTCDSYKSEYYTGEYHKEAIKRGILIKKDIQINTYTGVIFYQKFCYSHDELFPKCNYETPWTIDICMPVNHKTYDIHIPVNTKKEADMIVDSLKFL